MVKKAISKKPSSDLPDLSEEAKLGFFASDVLIIGVDEVGRGCLAGPVITAAAILDPKKLLDFPFSLETGARLKIAKAVMSNLDSLSAAILEVKDSKLVAEPNRAPMAEAVKAFVRGYAIAEANVEEIERLNILYASHLAMERAVDALEKKINQKAKHVLVDGNLIPRNLLGRGIPLIKGDRRSLTISCASIIAKVYRDELMLALDAKFPGYGLSQHKGYPTPFHKKQIEALGICEIHRKTFKGVRSEPAQENDLFT